jgi:hypothetical protein
VNFRRLVTVTADLDEDFVVEAHVCEHLADGLADEGESWSPAGMRRVCHIQCLCVWHVHTCAVRKPHITVTATVTVIQYAKNRHGPGMH